MYRTAYSTDILDVTFRPDTGLLIGRWMRSVSPAEMRRGYETMLTAALHYACRRWLLDIRRRSHSDEETARWVTEELLPQAAAQLGGTLFMSVLLSPTYLYEVTSRPTLAALPVDTNRSFRLQYFTDEREANDWLADKAGQ